MLKIRRRRKKTDAEVNAGLQICILIPVKINHSPFQYSQLAIKLLVGLLEEWRHIEDSVLVSLSNGLNRGRNKRDTVASKASIRAHRVPIREASECGQINIHPSINGQ